jgi:translocator protein
MSELASKSQLRWAILRAAAVIVPLTVMLGGLASNLAGGDQSGWYMTLQRPDWAPAADTFGIVWFILYLMIGLATAIIWYARGNPLRTAALVLFAFQLVLNIAWTPVFFGMKAMLPGTLLAVALLISALVTLVVFWRVRTSAGLLMVPYVAWLTLAAFLSYSLWQMNPDAGAPQGPQTLQLAPAP